LRAYLLADLGFGDAGKGLLTDYLARKEKAGLVVRYNGGAQAGHNVVTPDGLQHTFSQFGSATFLPGVQTWLSQDVVVHPGALLLEGETLERKGVKDAFSRIAVSDQALLVTPWHQAANRIREMARGEARHGSCGVGIGETVEDALTDESGAVRAGDLKDTLLLKKKLNNIRERKRAQLTAQIGENRLRTELAGEWEYFLSDEVLDAWLATAARLQALGLVQPDERLTDRLKSTETVIFEGAQGVLLDAATGFHPYTTWSDCTTAQAERLLDELAPDSERIKVGILRCYAVRHGPGPLPTESDAFRSHIHEHNQTNDWQGRVRYGWFDPILVDHALQAAGRMDTLAVTHLDLLPHLDSWRYCVGYDHFDKTFQQDLGSGNHLKLKTIRPDDFETRTKLTEALMRAEAVLQDCATRDESVLAKIEELTQHKIELAVYGKTALDVRLRG